MKSELCCRYYYSHNTGLQAQSVLYTQISLQAQGEELLDPNKWSSDGTVALSDYAFSKDGSRMAYSVGRWGGHLQHLSWHYPIFPALRPVWSPKDCYSQRYVESINSSSGEAMEWCDVQRRVRLAEDWDHGNWPKDRLWNKYWWLAGVCEVFLYRMDSWSQGPHLPCNISSAELRFVSFIQRCWTWNLHIRSSLILNSQPGKAAT